MAGFLQTVRQSKGWMELLESIDDVNEAKEHFGVEVWYRLAWSLGAKDWIMH